MIDSKVFADLMDRKIITTIGLNPEDYKDIADLKNHGLITQVAVEDSEDVEAEQPAPEDTTDIVVDDNE
jgi:hypothetical protein